MSRFFYLIYGLGVVIVSTITNLAYTGDSGGSSNWGGRSGGGSSYSSGGYSGGHK